MPRPNWCVSDYSPPLYGPFEFRPFRACWDSCVVLSQAFIVSKKKNCFEKLCKVRFTSFESDVAQVHQLSFDSSSDRIARRQPGNGTLTRDGSYVDLRLLLYYYVVSPVNAFLGRFCAYDIARSMQAILQADPMLQGHRGHLMYRWNQYENLKNKIVEAEGSLEAFALVRGLSA